MTYHEDSVITILGAGPAGLTAAIALGQAGIPCLVLDKHKYPRSVICGDGLGGKVLNTLNKLDPGYSAELGMKPYTTGSRSVRFYSPTAQMMELSFGDKMADAAAGYICKRTDFDMFLLNKASSFKSVRIEEQVQVRQMARENGHYVLRDNDGKILSRTRLLLFAAGSDRNLLNQMPLTECYPAVEGIGVRGYFQHVNGSDYNFSIELHFLRELLPWYFWIFPFNDGSANVGLALPENLARKTNLSLKQLLFELIRKYPHLNSRIDSRMFAGKIEARRIPFYNGRCQVSGDNYMLLGDAARLVDPFTGEGIGNAMVSGYHAASVAARCVERNDFSALQTREYNHLLYAKLGPELDLSRRMQKLAMKPYLLNLVIGRASKNENLRRHISEMLYNDKAKKKLTNPLFYFKLMLGK